MIRRLGLASQVAETIISSNNTKVIGIYQVSSAFYGIISALNNFVAFKYAA